MEPQPVTRRADPKYAPRKHHSKVIDWLRSLVPTFRLVAHQPTANSKRRARREARAYARFLSMRSPEHPGNRRARYRARKKKRAST